MLVPSPVRHRRYRIRLQAGGALALALMLAAFTVPTPQEATAAASGEALEPPVLIHVPISPRTPPPPPAPPPPEEVPDTKDVVDAVVPEMDLGLTDAIVPTGPPAPPPPPPPPAPAPEAAPPPPDDAANATDVLEWLPMEDQPVLIGGLDGLQSRVVYPQAARRIGAEGTVFVQFVVDESGRVVEPQALRVNNAILAEAALKAVRESRFEPGRQRGRPVRVRITLPVRFVLR